MPGRFFLTSTVSEIAQVAGVSEGEVKQDPPRRNIQPGQELLVLGSDGLSHMRWGIIPVGRVNARGRPVMETIINARSETVFDKAAFDGVGRAVIPVNGWYEWTGEKRRKTAWRIRPVEGNLLFFAAISDVWTAPGGLTVPQVAAVTCEPNADVRDIHHRMGVILDPQDLLLWLTGSEKEARTLMQPWSNGRLQVERADDVDWSAP